MKLRTAIRKTKVIELVTTIDIGGGYPLKITKAQAQEVCENAEILDNKFQEAEDAWVNENGKIVATLDRGVLLIG
jgi:hypothetical protein